MKIIICDLDGTLSDCTHRVAYARQRDWEAFHARCEADVPYQDMVELVRVLSQAGGHIAIVTARPDWYICQTVEWLIRYDVCYHSLHMRYANDHRPSVEVKREVYENLKGYGQVWLAIEDRSSNVAMWRALGVTCLQCQDGSLVDGS